MKRKFKVPRTRDGDLVAGVLQTHGSEPIERFTAEARAAGKEAE